MIARARPGPDEPRQSELSPEDEADVRAGLEQAARGEFADLSAEESEHYLEAGELPERVRHWLDSHDTRPAF